MTSFYQEGVTFALHHKMCWFLLEHLNGLMKPFERNGFKRINCTVQYAVQIVLNICLIRGSLELFRWEKKLKHHPRTMVLSMLTNAPKNRFCFKLKSSCLPSLLSSVECNEYWVISGSKHLHKSLKREARESRLKQGVPNATSSHMLISAGESYRDFLMTLARGIQPPNSWNFTVRFCRRWQREQWEQPLLRETKTLLSSWGKLHLNSLFLALAVASVPSKHLQETAA